MNKIFLIGNLTRDPETRVTPNGKTVCGFDIAVNDRQGNATYFRISVWEKLGENCQRHLSKGKKVSVVGSVSARAYTDRNGKANISIEVSAQDVEFLSPAVHSVPDPVVTAPAMIPVGEEVPF